MGHWLSKLCYLVAVTVDRLIVASTLSLGAIFAPIPFDEKQYELSPLTISTTR